PRRGPPAGRAHVLGVESVAVQAPPATAPVAPRLVIPDGPLPAALALARAKRRARRAELGAAAYRRRTGGGAGRARPEGQRAPGGGREEEGGGGADDEQVLDIVATDQDQPAPAINCSRIDDGEPRLAPACGGGAQVSGAEAPDQPCGQSDQAQHHDEGEQESEAILPFAEQEIQHMLLPAPEGGWVLPSRLFPEGSSRCG